MTDIPLSSLADRGRPAPIRSGSVEPIFGRWGFWSLSASLRARGAAQLVAETTVTTAAISGVLDGFTDAPW
ncbi:MAG: hypothetical protein AAFP04_06195 [Myxococcota bacterium]